MRRITPAVKPTYAKPFRLIASLLVMLSWIVVTNHCALGLMTMPGAEAESVEHCGEKAGAHQHCPDHDGGPSKGDVSACCQAIKAPALQAVKLVSYDANQFVVQAYILTIFQLASLEPHLTALEIDTGPPPDSISFAESVLQRSILAHAPPLLA